MEEISLFDKIKRPEYYKQLQQEKNSRDCEQRRKDDEKRNENFSKARKLSRRAMGLKDDYPVVLNMEWMQPYPDHGWWVVSLGSTYTYPIPGTKETIERVNEIAKEWYGHSFFSGNFKRAGYKKACKEFEKIVNEYNLKEISHEV